MAVLIAMALGVGFLCGVCGIGGFLLIPTLSFGLGFSTHEAMSTVLFSLIFTGIASIWLYQRHGSINWRVSAFICLGALPFGFLGALHKALIGAPALNLVLALVIIFAGYNCLRPVGSALRLSMPRGTRGKMAALAAIGASVGYVAGLTGAGGPVLSIPLLMILGFWPLEAVGASYAVQVAAAAAGSLGNAFGGSINIEAGLWIGVVQVIGVAGGAYVAHRLPAERLRKFLACLCIAAGAYIGWQAYAGMAA